MRLSRIAAATLVSVLAAGSALGQQRARLGVILVIDQLPAAQFAQRIEKSRGGFKRLVEQGYRFFDVRYESAPTMTATGHATLSTGAYPSTHGVVANDWYDYDTGDLVYAAESTEFQIVGREPATHDKTAPVHLKAGTFSDSIKAANAAAKVVSLGGKDRSTMMLAGNSADVALWLDSKLPMFVTSTRYASELPAWVQQTNQRIAKAIVQGLVWRLPAGGFTGQGVGGERNYIRDLAGFGTRFPYPVSKEAAPAAQSDQLAFQPLIEEVLVDLALASVREEKLGQDDVPDLLAIAFSRLDEIGHQFGPNSVEADQAFQEMDGQIGRLLSGLDQLVGKGRYVVGMASDHSGAQVPETLVAQGVDAGRLDIGMIWERLEQEADKALGPGQWFAGYRTPGFFVQPEARAKLLSIYGRLRKVARSFPGVLDLALKSDVEAGRYGHLGELYRRGMDWERTPDFLLWPKPYWVLGIGDTSSHGSAHVYDRAVPMVFFGAGVRRGAGSYAQPIDFAPTMSLLLGVDLPSNTQGQPLRDVLSRFQH